MVADATEIFAEWQARYERLEQINGAGPDLSQEAASIITEMRELLSQMATLEPHERYGAVLMMDAAIGTAATLVGDDAPEAIETLRRVRDFFANNLS